MTSEAGASSMGNSILAVLVVTSWGLEDVTHSAITERDFASVARLFINKLRLHNGPTGVGVVPVVSTLDEKKNLVSKTNEQQLFL